MVDNNFVMDSSSLDILYIYVYTWSSVQAFLIYRVTSRVFSSSIMHRLMYEYTRYIPGSALKVAAIPIEEEGGRATF